MITVDQVSFFRLSPAITVCLSVYGMESAITHHVSEMYYVEDHLLNEDAYCLVDGSMILNNVMLAYFNDVCNRHDTAIQVSQSNDDGQFPITTSSMGVYNVSDANLIFNGKPNLGVVNPSQCGGKFTHILIDACFRIN